LVFNLHYTYQVQEGIWDTGIFTNATFAQCKERNLQRSAQAAPRPKPKRKKRNVGLTPGVL